MKERIDEKTILKYLPGLSRDICERSGISRQHTNICLKRLLDQNLVEIEKIVKVRGTPAPYYRLKKNECTNIILSLFGSGEEWSVTELTEETMLERKFVVSAVKSLSSKKKDQNSTPTEKRKDTRRHIPDSSGTGHSQTFGKTFPTLDRIGNA